VTGKRAACRFRENDVARGVRAAIKGGAKVKSIIIGKDTVTIECGSHEPPSAVADETPEDVIALLK
jgi:hypothetical protein